MGFAVGLEEGERYGDARFGAFYRVAERWRLGLDTRLRVDLERDADARAATTSRSPIRAQRCAMALG